MNKLQSTLTEIARLQLHYSPDNTVQMKQRGHLIRDGLVSEIRAREKLLKRALEDFGEDFDVGASDGIGRKTEAPWVRFFSKSMSPTPREGYYFVIHFSRDGRFVYFTVGCGSTIWENGSLKSIPKIELAKRVGLARGQILNVLGSLGSYKDQIDLGAKASLPKTFERATATAKKIDISSIEKVNLEDLLFEGARQLKTVYQMQSVGGDIPQSVQDQVVIDNAISPRRISSAKAQGFGLTGPERKAVELQAMKVASDWLVENGYTVTDTSSTESYDLLGEKYDSKIKVEVKGSTSFEINSFMMTSNEIRLHQEEQGNTILMLVSQINLIKGSEPICEGGRLEVLMDWRIDEWMLEPTSYRVIRQN